MTVAWLTASQALAQGQGGDAPQRTATLGAPTLTLATTDWQGGPTPLLQNRYRYGALGLVPRAALDLVAIPASMLRLDGTDWLLFGTVTASTVGMMWPAGPSPDVRFQRWITRHRSDTADALLPRVTSVEMAAAVLGTPLVMQLGSWAFSDPRLQEMASLELEAVGLTQTFHVTSKVLVGREGPDSGRSLGLVHGPTIRYFPFGTPSGHVASFTAMVAVGAEYYDSWPLRAVAIVGGTWFGAALVYRQQHFVSDIFWGAPMGYAVGAWVVRHRSSRFRYTREGVLGRVALLPMTERDCRGLQLVGQF